MTLSDLNPGLPASPGPLRQPMRIGGGLIDTGRSLRFTFDGRSYEGHPGDTLASALLANGVRLMGRAALSNRPCGPLTSGAEEPNALVELHSAGQREANVRATTTELAEGLCARSQNRWPSLALDVLPLRRRLDAALGAFLPAAQRPAPVEQAESGGGDVGDLACDLLIIGAGPAGLMAAQTAGRAGLQVILADQDFRFGGRLNAETDRIADQPGAEWAAAVVAELAGMANLRLMLRTAVTGAGAGGTYNALERVAGHPRQRLWQISCTRALFAGGAVERPLDFANADRPGIMLAGAMRAYANRWGVAVGAEVAVFTDNDDGLRSAADLAARGVQVVAVIDRRAQGPLLPGLRHIQGAQVVDTKGHLGLSALTLRHADGRLETLKVSALGISGGWEPCPQAGMPGPGLMLAGAAAGRLSTTGALRSGAEAARQVAQSLGRQAPYALARVRAAAPSALAPALANWPHPPGQVPFAAAVDRSGPGR